jgi:hypothetical protein
MLTREQKYSIIEIMATVLVVLGVSLNSINIYPLNIFVNEAASILWVIVSFYWKRVSLIVINILITAIYTAGVVKYFIT